MRVALLATDNREHQRTYGEKQARFSPPVEALLQGFARRTDIEMHVICCAQQQMTAPSKLADNIYYHLLHVPKIGWMRTGYQGCIRAIRRKLKQIQPDLVHGQGTERECAISAVFSGLPNIVTIHGNHIRIAEVLKARPGTYLWLAAQLERLTLPRAGGVFCNSAYTENSVRPYAKKTWQMPNPLREQFFESIPVMRPSAAKSIILNIGAIDPRKRQLDVLRLAQRLHTTHKTFELHFIGNINPRDRYAGEFLRQASAAEACGFARYVGPLDLAKILASFDRASALIHMPSEEAFGLVIAEALARNLKVFASDVGGIPDIAEGVEGAELFRKEHEDDLEAAVDDWLRGSRARPSTAAHAMESRYHPDIIASSHVAIYRSLLNLPGA